MKGVFILVIVLAAAGAAIFFWQKQQQAEAPPVEPTADISTPAVDDEPPIRHLVPKVDKTTQKEKFPPLPSLDQSDEPLIAQLQGIISKELMAKYFNLDQLIHRFVVTTDNLTRKVLPTRYRIANRPEKKFMAVKVAEDESGYIDPANAQRYTDLIGIVNDLDVEKTLTTYVYFYPHIQRTYQELGYPDAYFNDRLVAVIDHLLEAPEPVEPVKLVRPNVLYKYEDPELEALSAGQKILVRMGNANAQIVKAKLKTFRLALTSLQENPAFSEIGASEE